MRVLFLTPAFPPFPGGGERYARSLALALSQAGCQITVVTSLARVEADFWRPSAAAVQERQDGPLRVIGCPLAGVKGGRPGLLAWRKGMVLLSALPGNHKERLMRMARLVPPMPDLVPTLTDLGDSFDLIHAFNLSWEYPLVEGWRLAQTSGRSLVVTPFTHFGAGQSDRVARNSTMQHQRHILANADAVLPLTAIEAEGLVALGIPPQRITVVGGGLDPLPTVANATVVLQRYGLTTPFLLFIGRASYDKGAIHAAQAALTLRRSGQPLVLALAGQTTPEFQRFYARLSDVERQVIRPLGLVNETEKHALLESCAMLLLPSRTDSFGIVLLEAWAHGKPVIGARAGGIPGVIDHEENGLLVPFGDSRALAEAIQRLLTDSALSQKMGRNGQDKISRHYAWPKVCQRVEEVYRQIAG